VKVNQVIIWTVSAYLFGVIKGVTATFLWNLLKFNKSKVKWKGNLVITLIMGAALFLSGTRNRMQQ